jgi:hypothetical protein
VIDQKPPFRRVRFEFDDGSWEKFDLIEPAALSPVLIGFHPRTRREITLCVVRYEIDGSIEFRQCCPETAQDTKIRVIKGGQEDA